MTFIFVEMKDVEMLIVNATVKVPAIVRVMSVVGFGSGTNGVAESFLKMNLFEIILKIQISFSTIEF